MIDAETLLSWLQEQIDKAVQNKDLADRDKDNELAEYHDGRRQMAISTQDKIRAMMDNAN